MRFFSSLIKFFVYISVILTAAGAALFWFDTGEWLVMPLAKRAGNFFLDPLKLEIENINGSVRNGYKIKGVKLISGDEDFITLDNFAVSPDWDLALQGMNGIPFVTSVEISGLSSDLEKVILLSEHFGSGNEENKTSSSFDISTINPVNISVRDVNFGTPYADLKLDELNLDKAGNFFTNAEIISGENIFPLKVKALADIPSLEIISSELNIGNKGTGKFYGKLSKTFQPVKANLNLTALSLEELLKFSPVNLDEYKASGRLDGKFLLENENLSGVISMPRANITGIPMNFRLPFRWDMKNFAALDNANFNTQAARLKLNASADISTMKIKADGEAHNVSLYEIGKLFAPDMKLKGDGGHLKFNIDTKADENIFANTKADITAKMPYVSAMGLDVVKALDAHVKLNRREAPKISLNGEVFKGKLFARGEAAQDRKGNIKPQAIISLVNLDVPTLINTFPELRNSVKKPSGKITVRTKISENLNAETEIKSDKLTANGITLTNIFAAVNYFSQENIAELEKFSVNLGKGLIKAHGLVNINEQTFNITADTENLDPKIIPELKQLTGNYKLNAEASGNFSKPESIAAKAIFSATNAGYSGMTFGNVNVPFSYSNNILNIKNAAAKLPGGSLTFNGNVNLKNTSNPGLDLTASSNGINLADVFKAYKIQNKSTPVSGKIKGVVNVKGALNNAAVNAHVRGENIKAGDIVNIPNALIDAKGNTNKININKIEAKINGSELKGNGTISINQKNINKSSVNLYAHVKHLPLKPLLVSSMGSAPVTGVIDVDSKISGTLAKPELELKTDKTIYYGKIEIKDIKVNLKSPEENHYLINAAAKIENFKPEAEIDVKKKGEIWAYKVNTKPLDINRAVEIQMPSMSGMAKGFATVSVQGDTGKNSDIKIRAQSNEIKLIDKVTVKNISVPVTYSAAKNKVVIKNAQANLNDGIINSNVNVDLNKSDWQGKVKVAHLNFGKLAQPFMPEGEIVGTADAEVTAKGRFGVMPTSFANGKFSTTPGYIHKMAIIDKVTPTKKISFETISGSFFWDGKDLFLNPGTRAKAGDDEPLYRYFNVNGSLGIPGKGLKLLCDGRFDLKILDQLLGAMKGVFQYMTGKIANDILRDAAGRILGVKRRDFQSVSFTLANSWENLRLLNLKITKPIEDFLPIDILNKDAEKQKDDTQFKLNLKIPVGKGDKSVEEESTGEQFKQQLIDNLFNIGL